ncbi:MAG TPA: alcohol dehydrogenase catalytic domain-containing protein [Candidatus Methylomirabilis sp.]|nr:alcohol dehydrogenase catalytic domain-containing protein [Candidatus Methylomirabilis sp.]
MATMPAMVFEGNGRLTLKEMPVPRVEADDQALLRVEAASICGTDLQILRVPPGHPATPGTILSHEYTGEVLDAGNRVRFLKKGDRVVVDPNLTCGQCPYCRMGRSNLCEQMTTLGIFIHGGFAPYNVAPVRALHKIGPRTASEMAVFAEPLSCVVNGVRRVALQPGESALVLGAGPIGLYFIQMFRAAGAGKILAAEVQPFRAEMARRLGAERVIDPTKEDLAGAVREATGIGADAVVDAVGTLMAEALACVRRGGRILLFGMNTQAHPAIPQHDITRYEVEVLGTFIARHTFPAAIQIIESGVLDLPALITHRLPLRAAEEGFAAMRGGSGIKVIVDPQRER